jgi:hypothetical protein
MKRFCTIGLGIILAALIIGPIVVAGATAAPKKKVRTYDKISSIDSNSVSIITGAKGDTLQFVIDRFTTITVNDKAGKYTDVQKDMKADYAVRSDGKTLTKLDVADPPVDKTAKK